MSANFNDEALAHQQPTGGSGEFHASVPRDEPQTTHGHKPGVLTGNDTVPESHIQTLPAGSAPSDRTFQPDPQDEVAPSGKTSAADSLGGATSADVSTGLGQPAQGMTSAEIHHDGQAHRKNPGRDI